MTAKCGNKCNINPESNGQDEFYKEKNAELNTGKNHKDWYHPDTMGKQRGKPRYDLKETKKVKK